MAKTQKKPSVKRGPKQESSADSLRSAWSKQLMAQQKAYTNVGLTVPKVEDKGEEGLIYDRTEKIDDPEAAIEIARAYIIKLLQLTEAPTLEEVEIKDKYWFVTFSMPDLERGNFALLPLMPRKYKVLKVEASTGKFISMSIQDGKR